MSQAEDVATLAQGDDSRVVAARRFVIRDPQAFAAVWSAHAGERAAVPDVDFDRRMVVAVFAGERPTPGHSVSLAGSRRESDGLVLLVEEQAPDPSHVAPQVVVSPYHIATMPRDDGSIRFDGPDPGAQTIIFKAPRPSEVVPQSMPVETPIAVGADVSSDTGLTPHIAASLAYLAGPLSGALLLATERADTFVRFHAWQAVLGLGGLAVATLAALALAFAMLVFSPVAFWVMLWCAAALGALWLVLWATCVTRAYRGSMWKIPFVGAWAEAYANPTNLRAIEVR